MSMKEILEGYEEGECSKEDLEQWREYYGKPKENHAPKSVNSDVTFSELAIYFALFSWSWPSVAIKAIILIISYLIF